MCTRREDISQRQPKDYRLVNVAVQTKYGTIGTVTPTRIEESHRSSLSTGVHTFLDVFAQSVKEKSRKQFINR